MNLAAALRYLDAHTNLEATAGRVEGLSLDRMRRLAHTLGDPQDAFGVLHVTGTNGKGSVARMATALLRAQGLSVGTYTSPHLERINERIAWDGDPIGDDSLGDVIGTIAGVEDISGVTPSYFEILTAAALWWFADVAVDVAVLEVGMLGRYDATNVADATVAVCTNVGRDHTDGRGDWRAAIAGEKSDIVKGRTEVLVLGETDIALRPIFTEAGAGATWVLDEDFGCEVDRLAVGGHLVDLRTPGALHEDVFLPVHGGHQSTNAAIATAACEAFTGRAPDAEVVAEAFAGVTLPGRFEIMGHEPTIILDAAHNPDGAEAAARTLAEELTLTGSVLMVVGLLGGRDPGEMLVALGADEAGFVVACTPDSPRAIPAPEVAAVADRMGVVSEAVSNPVEALHRARALASVEDVILVAGSLYVVGPIRAALTAETVDP